MAVQVPTGVFFGLPSAINTHCNADRIGKLLSQSYEQQLSKKIYRAFLFKWASSEFGCRFKLGAT